MVNKDSEKGGGGTAIVFLILLSLLFIYFIYNFLKCRRSRAMEDEIDAMDENEFIKLGNKKK